MQVSFGSTSAINQKEEESCSSQLQLFQQPSQFLQQNQESQNPQKYCNEQIIGEQNGNSEHNYKEVNFKNSKLQMERKAMFPQKRQQKQKFNLNTFIPFVNERDKLGRLLINHQSSSPLKISKKSQTQVKTARNLKLTNKVSFDIKRDEKIGQKSSVNQPIDNLQSFQLRSSSLAAESPHQRKLPFGQDIHAYSAQLQRALSSKIESPSLNRQKIFNTPPPSSAYSKQKKQQQHTQQQKGSLPSSPSPQKASSSKYLFLKRFSQSKIQPFSESRLIDHALRKKIAIEECNKSQSPIKNRQSSAKNLRHQQQQINLNQTSFNNPAKMTSSFFSKNGNTFKIKNCEGERESENHNYQEERHFKSKIKKALSERIDRCSSRQYNLEQGKQDNYGLNDSAFTFRNKSTLKKSSSLSMPKQLFSSPNKLNRKCSNPLILPSQFSPIKKPKNTTTTNTNAKGATPSSQLKDIDIELNKIKKNYTKCDQLNRYDRMAILNLNFKSGFEENHQKFFNKVMQSKGIIMKMQEALNK